MNFWTPEYLETKQATLRLFHDHRILLAVAETTRQAMPETPNVISYKSKLPVESVLKKLNQC